MPTRLQDQSDIRSARLSRRELIVGAATIAMTGGLAGFADGASAQGTPEAGQQQQATTVPLALVVSPRLPIWEITNAAVSTLLDGSASDWQQVGCPIPVSIRRIGMDGVDTVGMQVESTVADYEALVAELDANPTTVGIAPVEQIDSRLTALRIDGVDPFSAIATEAEPVFHVGIAGDMIPGRNVNLHMRGYGDFLFPWRRVAPVLNTFDFTFGNFECVISDTIPFPEDTYANALDFVMPTDAIAGLQLAGFDALSLANNHSVYNGSGWGFDGFFDTMDNLNAAGVPFFGAGMDLDAARAPFVGEVAGKSIAIYGIDGVTANVDYPGSWSMAVNVGATASQPGTNPLIEQQIVADIEALAGQYDIVIPFFHMGEQYQWTLPGTLIQLCRKTVDAGATMAISSHPHVSQGMEWYRNTPMFYGLGNFIYDQMFTVDTSQGHMVDLTFRGNRVVNFRMHPIQIEDFTQPRLLGPNETVAYMDRMWRAHDFMKNHMNLG